MKVFIRSFIGIVIACGMLLAISLGLYAAGWAFNTILASKKTSVNTPSGKNTVTVILDAGHGGIDGGAVGVSGVLEKDLNLAIVQKLREKLNSLGYTVVLTRDSDMLLGDGEKGSRKQQDLKARVEAVEAQDDAVLISIHMNRFPDASVKGMTFYYSPNHPDSYALSESMHQVMLSELQRDNRRPMKEATSGIYLLYHTSVPAVLVECGFLSNALEEAMLSDETYQEKIAEVLCKGIAAYCEKSEEKP